MSILNILGLCILAYGVYKFIEAARLLINEVKEEVRQTHGANEQTLKDKLAEITHIVLEEIHDGRKYWFDADTDRFFAWGENRNELIETVKKRFPKHIFYLESTREFLCEPDWKPIAMSNTKELERVMVQKFQNPTSKK